MKVEVRQNEDAGTHELGATIDGVFVPFVSLPSTNVDTLVASGKLADTAEPAASGKAA